MVDKSPVINTSIVQEDLENKIIQYSESLWTGELPSDFHPGIDEETSVKRNAFYIYVNMLIERSKMQRETLASRESHELAKRMEASSRISAIATVWIAVLTLVTFLAALIRIFVP